MPILAALAFASLKRGLSTIVDWLSRRSFWQLVCIGLVVLIVVQRFGLWSEQRHSAKVEQQLSKCTAARKADRDSYAKAQADAALANKTQVQKIEQQYQRNSDNERQAYLDDLARLRAMRVRSQAPATPGSAGATIAPPASTPADGADADGLCVPASVDLQAVKDCAAEIELRLMHLQHYVGEQLSVDPNK